MRFLTSSLIGLALSASTAVAQTTSAARVSAPSSRASTEVTLTLADTAAQRAAGKPAVVRIDYGVPHLRGRALFTDSLVPYDKPWRLGANNATVLVTDIDLTLGGESLPRGMYTLQAMPTRAGWTLLVQKVVGTSPMVASVPYKAENDVARVKLAVSASPASIESLTMWLIPARAGAPRGELRIAWGTTVLSTEWAAK